jgi:hypothetical protein
MQGSAATLEKLNFAAEPVTLPCAGQQGTRQAHKTEAKLCEK